MKSELIGSLFVETKISTLKIRNRLWERERKKTIWNLLVSKNEKNLERNCSGGSVQKKEKEKRKKFETYYFNCISKKAQIFFKIFLDYKI